MKRVFTSFAIIFISVIAFTKLIAQPNCQDTFPRKPNCIALPRMYVVPEDGVVRQNEFLRSPFLGRSKYKKLASMNGVQAKSFFFTVKAVSDMLETFVTYKTKYEGIRLLFVRYNKAKRPETPFPELSNKEVIFLFSPVNSEVEKPDRYFFINDGDDKVYEVPSDCANNWLGFYENNLLKLSKTVDPNDASNQMPNNVPSDTRGIYYERENFEAAFLTEYCYQLYRHQITITGYKAVFAAYTKDGRNITEDDKYTYKKRLFLQFNYMHQGPSGKDIPLDLKSLTDDYDCRLAKLMQNKITGETYLNNGKLCPPHCP
jgi:hypothetical protein